MQLIDDLVRVLFSYYKLCNFLEAVIFNIISHLFNIHQSLDSYV